MHVDVDAEGDRVTFRPRDGAIVEGTVARVGERVAVVELDDPKAKLQPGTKGEARIPASRRAGGGVPPVPAPVPTPQETPEHPAWERKDDEWKPNVPLLAQVKPLRPSEREMRFTGRVYAIYDHVESSEDDRSDDFARGGTALHYVVRNGGNPQLIQALLDLKLDINAKDDDGLTALESGGPFDAAALDLKLGRDSSMPIAERLTAAGVPFVFLTGAPNEAGLARQFGAAPVVGKPFSSESLLAALAKAPDAFPPVV